MAKQKAESEKVRADEATSAIHLAQAGAEPPEGEQAAEKAEPERLSHWEASHRVVQGIDGDTTLSELAHDADEMVIAGGGRSNMDRCWNTIYGLLQSLQEMGMLEMTEEISVHPLHRLPSVNGQK
jgi:hypothetical protein